MDDIVFREYRDEDYEGFIGCILDFYDNGYPYPFYINRCNLSNLIFSGEMIVSVAENKEGKIVGTVAALDRAGDFDGGILLMLRAVLSSYRGNGIASRQLEYLLGLIHERFADAKCYYADVMTHDCISQSSLFHRGYTFCGLRLMAYRNEIIAPKIHFRENTKMSQAVFCKAIKYDPVTVYCPAEHKELIGRIYDDLGVKAAVLDKAETPKGATDWVTEDDRRNEFAEIIIRHTGEDFYKVKDEAKSLLSNNRTVIAYINMQDKGSISAYNELVKLGFYFSGISPLFIHGDYLILSQTDNCLENFEDIGIYKNKEQVINYILGGRKK